MCVELWREGKGVVWSEDRSSKTGVWGGSHVTCVDLLQNSAVTPKGVWKDDSGRGRTHSNKVNNVEGGYSAPDSLVCCEGGTYDR